MQDDKLFLMLLFLVLQIRDYMVKKTLHYWTFWSAPWYLKIKVSKNQGSADSPIYISILHVQCMIHTYIPEKIQVPNLKEIKVWLTWNFLKTLAAMPPCKNSITVIFWFKEFFNLQIHLHKRFFSDSRF